MLLKSCPFCGGPVELWKVDKSGIRIGRVTDEEVEENKIYAFVHCYGCYVDADMGTDSRPKSVIEAWNNRVYD